MVTSLTEHVWPTYVWLSSRVSLHAWISNGKASPCARVGMRAIMGVEGHSPQTCNRVVGAKTSWTRMAWADAPLRQTTQAALERSDIGIDKAQGYDRGLTEHLYPLSRTTTGYHDPLTFGLV